MRRQIEKLCYVLLTISGLFSVPAMACVEMVACIEGVDGESVIKGYDKCIDINGWSWGVDQPANQYVAGGGTRERPNFVEFSFTKYADTSSPVLMKRSVEGTHIQEAKIHINRCTESKISLYEFIFNQVLVSSIDMGGFSVDDRPTEVITLNFAKFQFSYTPQNADGSAGAPVEFFWDVKLDQ